MTAIVRAGAIDRVHAHVRGVDHAHVGASVRAGAASHDVDAIHAHIGANLIVYAHVGVGGRIGVIEGAAIHAHIGANLTHVGVGVSTGAVEGTIHVDDAIMGAIKIVRAHIGANLIVHAHVGAVARAIEPVAAFDDEVVGCPTDLEQSTVVSRVAAVAHQDQIVRRVRAAARTRLQVVDLEVCRRPTTRRAALAAIAPEDESADARRNILRCPRRVAIE